MSSIAEPAAGRTARAPEPRPDHGARDELRRRQRTARRTGCPLLRRAGPRGRRAHGHGRVERPPIQSAGPRSHQRPRPSGRGRLAGDCRRGARPRRAHPGDADPHGAGGPDAGHAPARGTLAAHGRELPPGGAARPVRPRNRRAGRGLCGGGRPRVPERDGRHRAPGRPRLPHRTVPLPALEPTDRPLRGRSRRANAILPGGGRRRAAGRWLWRNRGNPAVRRRTGSRGTRAR